MLGTEHVLTVRGQTGLAMFPSLGGGMLASSPPLPNPGRQLRGGGSCEAKISFGGWRGWGLLKGRNELGQRWGVGPPNPQGLWESGQRWSV